MTMRRLHVSIDDQHFLNGQSPPQVMRTATQHTAYKLFQISRAPVGNQVHFDEARSSTSML